MAVRSRRLFGPTALSDSAILLYTVPADRTAVLRSLLIANAGALSSQVALYVNGLVVASIAWIATVAGGVSVAVPEDIILNPGDTLHGTRSGTSAVNAGGYGSLLLGAPE